MGSMMARGKNTFPLPYDGVTERRKMLRRKEDRDGAAWRESVERRLLLSKVCSWLQFSLYLSLAAATVAPASSVAVFVQLLSSLVGVPVPVIQQITGIIGVAGTMLGFALIGILLVMLKVLLPGGLREWFRAK